MRKSPLLGDDGAAACAEGGVEESPSALLPSQGALPGWQTEKTCKQLTDVAFHSLENL